MNRYKDSYLEENVLYISRALYSIAKIIAFNTIISEMAHHPTCQYCLKSQTLHTRKKIIIKINAFKNESGLDLLGKQL